MFRDFRCYSTNVEFSLACLVPSSIIAIVRFVLFVYLYFFPRAKILNLYMLNFEIPNPLVHQTNEPVLKYGPTYGNACEIFQKFATVQIRVSRHSVTALNFKPKKIISQKHLCRK